MNLNRIDLNLFAVFDAIYTAGSLTKAADILCITQPAVSNSLARLRNMFGDPLFVRSGHTMTPTPVAQNIIGPARQALDLMRNCVLQSHDFNPKTSPKSFHFACRDLVEASILPRLIARIAPVAPLVSINNYDIQRSKVSSALASGQLDFFVDHHVLTAIDIEKRKIAQDKLVAVARKGHATFNEPLSIESLIACGHIKVVQQQDDTSQIDIELSKLGISRKIAMQSHHFLTVPSILVKTDLIAFLPFHLAKHYDLAIRELPLDISPLTYYLHWHASANEDPAHTWLREQIFDIALSFTHGEPR